MIQRVVNTLEYMEVMMNKNYRQEDAAEDRKNALLATLEMMTGVVKTSLYEDRDNAVRVADWLTSFSAKDIQKITFYALLDHIDFIFNWIGMEI